MLFPLAQAEKIMVTLARKIADSRDRRRLIGGSDARIIMGDDEAALVRLWREKRGEVEPEDLTNNLIVQLGTVTEHLNRHWYERNTGQVVTEVQRQVFHPVKRWMEYLALHLRDDLAGIAFIPVPVEVFGHGAELYDQVVGKVFRF